MNTEKINLSYHIMIRNRKTFEEVCEFEKPLTKNKALEVIDFITPYLNKDFTVQMTHKLIAK